VSTEQDADDLQALNATDPRIAQQPMQRVARRIDRVLRGHFARHALVRLIRPMRHPRERGRQLWLGAPSLWLVHATLALTVLTLFCTWAPPWLAHWRPDWAARIPEWPWHWSLSIAAVLFALERLLLPRLLLATHRFRLMRLEHTDGAADFPHVYSVARVDSSTGFGWQAWRGTHAVRPGDLVVAVSDRRDRGVALIPLRSEGRLPAIGWDREVLIHDAFKPIGSELRRLAEAFDRCCTRNPQVADALERTRALRTGHIQPKAAQEPGAAWAEVVLPAPAKQRLMAMAEDFTLGRASASRGLLLYGPPGTGKSLIARTFARSMDCAFFPLSLPDLKSGHVGQSGENVRTLWRKAAAESRAVIFIDECEGVFGRRGSTGTDSAVEEIVAAFLAQWEGFERHTRVWVIGATNRRELLDAAILSRFEEQLEIGLPDGAQRQQILLGELNRLNVRAVLPAEIDTLTQGMSGRELATLAKRLVREGKALQPGPDGLQTVNAQVLAALAQEQRKQGSTTTDDSARWDTLVLPEDTLRDLKTTAGMLQHANAFRQRGIGVPRGLLLYGPPGTGKTQVARTLANETGLRFIAASTADIKQGFVGQSGQKVRELFARARESAPCLLFIDEIDIVAAARGGGDSFQAEIVGQLLQEMDGARADTQPVFVLAATNRIDQLDDAVLSRLPKRIEIPLPNADARARILAVLLRGKPVMFPLESGAAQLAARAEGRSGRDLRSWVESAELRAVARAIDAGAPETVTIGLGDFG
jgi:SpoVK/Ycf46/Vps4 family AAA+-type ATPase